MLGFHLEGAFSVLRAVSLFPHQLALSPETELRATAKAEAPPAPGRASSSRASEPGKPARSGCTGEQASAPRTGLGTGLPRNSRLELQSQAQCPGKTLPSPGCGHPGKSWKESRPLELCVWVRHRFSFF